MDLAAHLDQARCVTRETARSLWKLTGAAVTIGGAVLFLIFGLVYTYEAYAWDDAALEGLPAIAGTVADAAIQAAKQGDGLVGGGLDVALDNDA